jgi:hypothetical protein
MHRLSVAARRDENALSMQFDGIGSQATDRWR